MLTETQFKEIHDRFVQSGLTIRSFCANEGICEAKFYYWRSKLKRFLPGTNGFVPFLINHSLPSGLSATTGNSLSQSLTNGICFEVCYANGTRLKLEGSIHLELLRSLIALQLEQPGENRAYVIERVKKGRATTDRYLKLLKDSDIIEFVGSDKTGGYYLTEKAKDRLK